MPAEYDCLACGRCCFAGDNYVEVFPEELVKLGPVNQATYLVRNSLSPEKRRTGETEATLFMRMESGHCAALDATPGRYACRIYADRPILCEVFEPGSPSCLRARATVPAGYAEISGE